MNSVSLGPERYHQVSSGKLMTPKFRWHLNCIFLSYAMTKILASCVCFTPAYLVLTGPGQREIKLVSGSSFLRLISSGLKQRNFQKCAFVLTKLVELPRGHSSQTQTPLFHPVFYSSWSVSGKWVLSSAPLPQSRSVLWKRKKPSFPLWTL